MRVIQTFFTQKGIDNAIQMKGGWLSNESFYMCWALSCLNAKRIYGNIELYTDEKGYDLLINQFKLPYDKAEIIFSNKVTDKIPPKLWSLSKIYTYGKQDESFIHIDGDFLFWEKIDFEEDLIFQNLEQNDLIYKSNYDYLHSLKSQLKPGEFLKCLEIPYSGFAANMGIFGCYDVSFTKKYCKDVFDFIDKIDLELFVDYYDSLNIFLEQYYVFYLCKNGHKSFKTIHPDIVESPTISHVNFFYQPDSNRPFNHFLGNSKRFEHVNDYVTLKLKEFYSENYEIINEILHNNLELEYFYICKKNKNIDIERVFSVVKNKLEKFDIRLSEHLNEDLQDFFNSKYDYLNNYTETTNIFKRNNLEINKDTFVEDDPDSIEIKLSDSILDIKNYFYPWDIVFDNICHDLNPNNIEPFLVLSKKKIKPKEFFCIFYNTEFQKAVSTFWVKDIVAYIVIKILNDEPQKLSSILFKVKNILKSQSKGDITTIKPILGGLLIKLYNYGILEIKLNKNHNINTSSISSLS